MKDLTFSFNWNNKLYCKAFTTMRMNDKLEVGDVVRVLLEKKKNEAPEVIGIAKVHAKKKIKIAEINDYLAYIDTGYNADECRGILHNMYKNSAVYKKKKVITLYLIRMIKDSETV